MIMTKHGFHPMDLDRVLDFSSFLVTLETNASADVTRYKQMPWSVPPAAEFVQEVLLRSWLYHWAEGELSPKFAIHAQNKSETVEHESGEAFVSDSQMETIFV